MMKEAKDQVKAKVGIDRLWKSLKDDMKIILPKVMPTVVANIEILEGDGGLGTVLLFTFGPDVPKIQYQKEKIVDLDETVHRIGLQVIEGGHLDLGFSFYQFTIQLTAVGDDETEADITVTYQNETEQNMPAATTTSSAISLIKSLESYLLSNE